MDNNELKIESRTTIQNLLKKMDKSLLRLFLVYKEDIFLGVVSIGDVQRAILRKESLETPIIKIMRPYNKQRFASPADSLTQIKKMMKKHRMEMLPVVDEYKNVCKVYLWEDLFSDKKNLKKHIGIPVVIMAGGFGTRMKPLTNVIPKPLIPINEKPIIEDIMSQFADYGCNEFHLSVNYKASMIQNYFKEIPDCPYNIYYHKEEKPTGTAGSLWFMKEYLNTTFFISNCDITINEDYYNIYNYHKKNKNELTLVAAMKHYPVPYGVVETTEGGKLSHITEKPDFLFQINTGLYLLEPHLLEEIPENSFFHITHLIEKIKKRNGIVGVFPISESSWNDIGDWDEYYKTLRDSQ